MRKATKTVATWLGVAAGLAGIEHGVFEILQGNARPEGVMIVSMGPPCDPEVAWNTCEPAMTILPNFLITGILAVLFGLAILVWSVGFIHHKHGGLVLMLLSVALLLFGGGLFPPLIGFIGGAAATQINRPVLREPDGVTRIAAKLWPWPLVLLLVWLLGQFPVGYFFNDFLKRCRCWHTPCSTKIGDPTTRLTTKRLFSKEHHVLWLSPDTDYAAVLGLCGARL